jgi:hypothetical protein
MRQNGLVKLLTHRHTKTFPSRGIAKLFLMEAKRSKNVVIYKASTKQDYVALSNYFHLASGNFPDIATDKEVAFVRDILWGELSGACVDRKIINRRLEDEFPVSMAKPQQRNRVCLNGLNKKLFFVAKGPRNQIIGLSFEDAELALHLEMAIASETVTENATGDQVESVHITTSSDHSDDSSEKSEDGIDISALFDKS